MALIEKLPWCFFLEGNTGNKGNTVVETYTLREFFRRGIRERRVAMIVTHLAVMFKGRGIF